MLTINQGDGVGRVAGRTEHRELARPQIQLLAIT